MKDLDMLVAMLTACKVNRTCTLQKTSHLDLPGLNEPSHITTRSQILQDTKVMVLMCL
jgi:hypothetical protein